MHRTMVIAVSFLLLFGISVGLAHISHASTSIPLSGYAWSDNIGWISFNCADAGACASSQYGVTMDPVTGALSGYAWSDNIGWISFNTSDVAGCPSGTCAPSIDMSTDMVTGWAKALSADNEGWDGWINLSDMSGTYPYGATFTNDAASGYSWGSDVVGWVSWSGSGYGVTIAPIATPTATLSASPQTIDAQLGQTSFTASLTWSSTNAATCAGGNFSTGGATSGSTSAALSSNTVYTVTCTGSGGSASANALVTINYPAPATTLAAAPPIVNEGDTALLTWNVSNTKADSCSVSRQDGGWSQNFSNASTDGGTITLPPITVPSTFTLTCTGLSGSTVSNQFTINLIPQTREI